MGADTAGILPLQRAAWQAKRAAGTLFQTKPPRRYRTSGAGNGTFAVKTDAYARAAARRRKVTTPSPASPRPTTAQVEGSGTALN